MKKLLLIIATTLILTTPLFASTFRESALKHIKTGLMLAVKDCLPYACARVELGRKPF